jgi:hypothetical protein
LGPALLPGPHSLGKEISQSLTYSFRGCGYIGSFTALALLEAGYKVVIIDNLYNSSQEVINRIELICGKRPEFVSLDIRDEKAFDDVFSKHPDIDSVIHFAALKVRQVAGNGNKFVGIIWTAVARADLVIGCRRVRRNTSRVLPDQCLRHTLPATLYGSAQCLPHCLLFLRHRLRRRH